MGDRKLDCHPIKFDVESGELNDVIHVRIKVTQLIRKLTTL